MLLRLRPEKPNPDGIQLHRPLPKRRGAHPGRQFCRQPLMTGRVGAGVVVVVVVVGACCPFPVPSISRRSCRSSSERSAIITCRKAHLKHRQMVQMTLADII